MINDENKTAANKLMSIHFLIIEDSKKMKDAKIINKVSRP